MMNSMKRTLQLGLALWFSVSCPSFAQTSADVGTLIENQAFEQALSVVDQALLNDSSNRKLLLQRGFILIRLGLLEQAEAHYLGLITLMPEVPEPMNNLGAIYQLQGKLGKAVRQLNETIKTFPDFLPAYENLGDTYIQIAAHQYGKGLAMNPEHISLQSKVSLSQRFQTLAQSSAKKITPEEEPQEPVKLLTTDPEALKQAVTAFMASWADAWSSQNVEEYLSHYAQDFIPHNDMTLDEWAQRKTAILQSAQFIKVTFAPTSIDRLDDNHVQIGFIQTYKSNHYESTANKVLVLRYESGQFIIAKEY